MFRYLRILSLCLCFCYTSSLKAETVNVTVDNVIYRIDLNTNEAAVQGPSFELNKRNTSTDTEYDITIQSSVSYNDKSYDVTSIDDYAFYGGCNLYSYVNNVRSLKFADNCHIKTIGYGAFCGCDLAGESGQDVITIPSSVKTLKQAAFCFTRAYEFYFEDGGVETIGKSAFYDDYRLTKIHLPNTLKSIGGFCISWTPVKNLSCTIDGVERDNYLPHGLETLDDFAFTLSNLVDITLPNTLVNFGGCVFLYCPDLQHIYLEPNSNFMIGTGADEGVMFSKDGKELLCFPQNNPYIATKRFQYKVPTSVKKIGAGAFGFYGSGVVKSVVLPKDLEEIGFLAFDNDFTHLTIPANVTAMGKSCIPSGAELVMMGDYKEGLLENALAVYGDVNIFTYNKTGELSHWRNLGTFGEGISVPVYVKKEYYDNYKNINKSYGSNEIKSVEWKIPIQPSKKLTSLCRDFDINIDDSELGDTPGLYIATSYNKTGMTGDGVTGEDGKYYQFYMSMTPITYVPSRTGTANNDYTGVVVKVDDTSKTYYYEIGESDCYSTNQTTLSQTNYLFGAPCYTYVRTAEAEDGSAGTEYRTLGLKDGIFSWYKSDGIINEFKAFLRLPTSELNGAKSFTMVFEDANTTGIDSVKPAVEAKDAPWYDLQGRQLKGKPTTSGLYLHGSKKVVVP